MENGGAGRRFHLRHLLRAPLEFRPEPDQRLLLGRVARGRIHVGAVVALQRMGRPRGDPEHDDGQHHLLRVVGPLLGDRSGQRRAQIRARHRDPDDRRQAQLGDGTGLFRPCLRLFLGRAPVGRRAAEPAADRIGRPARDLPRACAESRRLCADRLRHRIGAGALRRARIGQVSGYEDGRADAQSGVLSLDVLRPEGRRRLPGRCRGCARSDRHLPVAAVRRLRPDFRPHGRQREAFEEQQGGGLRPLQRPDRIQDGRLQLVFRLSRSLRGQGLSGQSRADLRDAVARLRRGIPRKNSATAATTGATPASSTIWARATTVPTAAG